MLLAYIDESGDRGTTPKSSDYFVMTAVVVRDTHVLRAEALLATIKRDLRRQPTDELSWKKLKTFADRFLAAHSLGSASFLRIISVIVCKRHLPWPNLPNEHYAYLYTLRYLLERLSWLARDHGTELDYTLAHIVRFRIAYLRRYEALLKGLGPATEIHWQALPTPGRIDQPSRLNRLQLADIAASATAAAFESRGGSVVPETRYLLQLVPALYRHPPGRLTSYGLKIHPNRSTVHALHPWLATLN